MTAKSPFSTLRTRLKMACHRVYARRRKATPSLVIHMYAGTSTNWLKMLESAPSAWGGHIVDTERAFYDHGPGARAGIRDESIEAHRARLVGCEQILSALTPGWQRNPVNAAVEIARRGYAVYDGPHVQPAIHPNHTPLPPEDA